jgi:hypothetical protein
MKTILREYAIPIDPADPTIGPGVTPLDQVRLVHHRVDIHVFLPCDHEERVSFEQLVSGQRPPASEETLPRCGATRVGNFGERQWGISVSAITSSSNPAL